MSNHSFNVQMADRHGVDEAIMIEQLYWWIHHNECEEEMVIDGRIWCRCSAKGFRRWLSYMSEQKIARILRQMEEKKMILVGNFNKKATNQTKWYTFTDAFKKKMEEVGYDFSKMKTGIFKNEKSYNSIINNPINKEYTVQEEEKIILSDDNIKKDFDHFYKLYPKKKSKSVAEKAWNKLSAKDKKEAIDKLPAYIADCLKCKRDYKYPSTYLNQRTWEDDFNISKESVLCYDPLPDDEDMVLRFKRWMRENHAEIEHTEKPLTFDGYMRLQNEYGMDEVCEQLDYIDANIGKFRKCDIEASIKYYFEHRQYD